MIKGEELLRGVSKEFHRDYLVKGILTVVYRPIHETLFLKLYLDVMIEVRDGWSYISKFCITCIQRNAFLLNLRCSDFIFLTANFNTAFKREVIYLLRPNYYL